MRLSYIVLVVLFGFSPHLRAVSRFAICGEMVAARQEETKPVAGLAGETKMIRAATMWAPGYQNTVIWLYQTSPNELIRFRRELIGQNLAKERKTVYVRVPDQPTNLVRQIGEYAQIAGMVMDVAKIASGPACFLFHRAFGVVCKRAVGQIVGQAVGPIVREIWSELDPNGENPQKVLPQALRELHASYKIGPPSTLIVVTTVDLREISWSLRNQMNYRESQSH